MTKVFSQAFSLWVVFCLALFAALPRAVPADDKPAEPTKPADVAKPETKPAETPKPETPKPDAPKPPDPPKPDAPKPTEPPKPAEGEKKPAEILPGHSLHGEAFNEGPRQAAYLMHGMPKVRFPVTAKDPQVQKFVEQGIGQLHGFWFFEAERSFRQAAAIDPECAIAYWGVAMANIENEGRAKSFIAEAVKRKGSASEREQMYIDAYNAFLSTGRDKNKERSEAWTRSFDKILYKFPDDLEAKAFLALRLWRNRDAGVAIPSYLAVDGLLSEIFAVEPMHPSQHYRIHLWDDEKAERALAAAAVNGQTSPGIAHQWHMSGHIFWKVKRYDDAAWQHEASARVDHAHMMRDRVIPDQIHNFAHNNEWLIRDLVNIGRVRGALDLAKNMCELPRHPKYNMPGRGSSNYGRMRLFEVCSTYELWDELIALCNSPYLDPTDIEAEQFKRLRFLGAAYFRKGDVEGGKAQLAEVQTRLMAQKEAQDKAGTEAETKAKEATKPQEEIDKAKNEARKGFDNKIQESEKVIAALEGHQALAAGDAKAALPLFTKAGGVNPGYLPLVHLLAGEKEEAEKQARQYVNANKNEVQPLAVLIDVLWRLEKKDEAKKVFDELRELSGTIDDLSVPAFARLAPIAKELQLPDDWRVIKPPKTDVGQRPPLDSLGPFRWSPSPAADWTLNDAEGKPHALAEFHGRPIVLIFYLGSGCLHCAQQLQAFGPLAKEFNDAGLTLVAISSDDAPGLKTSIENYKDGPLPITLLSNSDLNVFKSYRCHDDFEKKPLHGTFVIDGTGLVRWQDIGFEPFQDAKFLLGESKRLLSQPTTRATPNATAAAQ